MIFKEKINLPIRWIVLIVFFLIIIVCSIYLFGVSKLADKNFDANLSSIIGGLIAGLIIAVVQFLLSWYEYKRNDLFEKIGVIDILNNKYKEDIYRNIIKNTKSRLWIMGNTADDFLNDFADVDNTENEKKVLLPILAQGVDVRILVAKKDFLFDERSKRKYDNAASKLNILQSQYPNSFKVKFYDHEPTQSIFIFDNQCFVGPVFPGIPSRQTPALHMKNKSIFAKRYIKYFEDEWAKISANSNQ